MHLFCAKCFFLTRLAVKMYFTLNLISYDFQESESHSRLSRNSRKQNGPTHTIVILAAILTEGRGIDAFAARSKAKEIKCKWTTVAFLAVSTKVSLTKALLKKALNKMGQYFQRHTLLSISYTSYQVGHSPNVFPSTEDPL